MLLDEAVSYGPCGLQATFQWKKKWYRIPFFVLEDILNEMINGKRMGSYELSVFLNTWKWPAAWNYVPIKDLKSAIKYEMPGMEAYLLHDQSSGNTSKNV